MGSITEGPALSGAGSFLVLDYSGILWYNKKPRRFNAVLLCGQKEEIMNTEKQRSSFSGKIGFVLSAAGSAVGLGNIWRFPYLAAKYGGGIFLLVYLILVLTSATR